MLGLILPVHDNSKKSLNLNSLPNLNSLKMSCKRKTQTLFFSSHLCILFLKFEKNVNTTD